MATALALGLPCLAASAPADGGPAQGAAAETADGVSVQLRLRPIRERIAAKDGQEPEIVKKARGHGVDLSKTPDPFVAHAFDKDKQRLFYVFFNVVDTGRAPRPWVLQRIRKEERLYGADGKLVGKPKVTWLVEAFKLGHDGAMKRADQHDGSFGLGRGLRREIVKKCEIGFGEVPDAAQGQAWPFDPKTLYACLQDYQDDKGRYDQVRFTTSVKWTLDVRFDRDGNYSIKCPELGFDAPKEMPKETPARK